MFKVLLTLFLSTFLLFACSKKNKEQLATEVNEKEIAIAKYNEAIKALDSGDAYFAGKKLFSKVCY